MADVVIRSATVDDSHDLSHLVAREPSRRMKAHGFTLASEHAIDHECMDMHSGVVPSSANANARPQDPAGLGPIIQEILNQAPFVMTIERSLMLVEKIEP